MDDQERIRVKFASEVEVQRFSARHGREPPALAIEWARRYLDPQGWILGLGCGTGLELWALRRLGYRRLVGLDIAWPMLEAARDLAPDPGGRDRLVHADALRPCFRPGSLAGAVVIDQLASLIPGAAGRLRLLREVARLLAPGAPVVLSYLKRGRSWRHGLYFALTAPAFALARLASIGNLEAGDRISDVASGTPSPTRIRVHYFRSGEMAALARAAGFEPLEEAAGDDRIGYLAARWLE